MPVLNRMLLGVLAVGVLAWLGGCTSAGSVIDKGNIGASQGTGFMIKTVQNGERQRKYSLFIPHNYDRRQSWPVIMFLHGVGEGGTDAEHNLTVGLAPEVAERAATFKFIVVFPQSASGNWDADSNAAADAIAALEQVERDYNVDRDRVWLTGVSTGGYGTWAIGAKYKDHFTGLVPLCAFADNKDVDQLTDMPIWCFHNAGDPFVLAAGSHAMCEQINDKGGHARYTEYLAVGHDVWVRAYHKDELYDWMFNTRRSSFARGPNQTTITASAVGTAVEDRPARPVYVAPQRVAPSYTQRPAAPAPVYVAPMQPVGPAVPTAAARPGMPAVPAPRPQDSYVPMVW